MLGESEKNESLEMKDQESGDGFMLQVGNSVACFATILKRYCHQSAGIVV
jgi:hypothetical protein